MTEKKISRETREGLLARARKMRTKPTDAEEHLWQHLRERRLAGNKFRRQHLIGAYIVDFYCPEARLIIEVDGPVHDKLKEYDQHREGDLLAGGYKVIRFTNKEIFESLDGVLKKILDEMQSCK
ncbi:MAG: endonuclease domain-containing protein [Anaerolineales bacterium]|nr:endonuclease domain-containing protein [Anaerolineales bacterium]